jgi:hypothetical protein
MTGRSQLLPKKKKGNWLIMGLGTIKNVSINR